MDTGTIEGRNVGDRIPSWAEDKYDRLPALATDLVGRRVAVIVAYTDAAALAAKTVTTTIPIVFLSGSDPVRAGIVPSLNQPGESITGVSWFGVDLVRSNFRCCTTRAQCGRHRSARGPALRRMPFRM